MKAKNLVFKELNEILVIFRARKNIQKNKKYLNKYFAIFSQKLNILQSLNIL